MPSVGLAAEVELVGLALGEAIEEGLNESVVVDSGLVVSGLVVGGVAAVAETDAGGLLYEEDVGDLVPAELVVDDVSVRVRDKGTVLGEETEEATASRSAVRPEDDGVVGGISVRGARVSVCE